MLQVTVVSNNVIIYIISTYNYICTYVYIAKKTIVIHASAVKNCNFLNSGTGFSKYSGIRITEIRIILDARNILVELFWIKSEISAVFSDLKGEYTFPGIEIRIYLVPILSLIHTCEFSKAKHQTFITSKIVIIKTMNKASNYLSKLTICIWNTHIS